LGAFFHLVQELRTDEERFFNYFRMTVKNFDYLLNLIHDKLKKIDTNMRKAISPHLKLAVTLHYLAEGSSLKTVSFHFRLGISTTSGIILETCQALYQFLQPLYMTAPQSPTSWKSVAKGCVLCVQFFYIVSPLCTQLEIKKILVDQILTDQIFFAQLESNR